jgi:hypothetical protein
MMEAERVRQYVLFTDTLGDYKTRTHLIWLGRLAASVWINFALRHGADLRRREEHTSDYLNSIHIAAFGAKLFWHVPFGNGRHRFALDFGAHLLFTARAFLLVT